MIVIDYSDRRPLYEQITERFKQLIVKGVLLPDNQMPSVRNLAMELSINPNTIQRSYQELERQGFIYSVKGRGNFVRDNKSLAEKQKAKLLHDFQTQLKACRSLGIEKKELEHYLDEIYTEVKQ